MSVAPHGGAWIETVVGQDVLDWFKSHPTGVRGLKQLVSKDSLWILRSHPTGVRGLKLSLY